MKISLYRRLRLRLGMRKFVKSPEYQELKEDMRRDLFEELDRQVLHGEEKPTWAEGYDPAVKDKWRQLPLVADDDLGEQIRRALAEEQKQDFDREVERRGPGRLEWPRADGPEENEKVDWDIDVNIPLYTRDYLMQISRNEHWPDIEDPREQCEAMLGIKLENWQWDWIQHVGKGERLVLADSRRKRYKWVKDEQPKVMMVVCPAGHGLFDIDKFCTVCGYRVEE